MREVIEKRFNELIAGLADLYIQKEEVEKQINNQRVAIEQCRQLLKAGEQNEGVQEGEPN